MQQVEPVRPLEVRNLRFDLSAVPRHWHGGRRSVTAFFDNLSVFFPEGERFFVRAVRAHAKRVQHDPSLKRDVNGFCGQEGVHTREHERYNDLLRAQGYPIDRLEQRVARILANVDRFLPARFRLAASCALEHFTALMGHMLLGDEALLEGANPEMAKLWRWHAAEENEHKSLAYDVYLAAGGNDVERVAIMAAATVIFWALVLEHQARFMARDGILSSPREWGALGWFLFGDPGGLRKLIPHYLRYYKPGFHPRDIDDAGLLETWRAAYETVATAA
jgi:hypothetical protein